MRNHNIRKDRPVQAETGVRRITLCLTLKKLLHFLSANAGIGLSDLTKLGYKAIFKDEKCIASMHHIG